MRSVWPNSWMISAVSAESELTTRWIEVDKIDKPTLAKVSMTLAGV